jgi:hypothetical protein
MHAEKPPEFNILSRQMGDLKMKIHAPPWLLTIFGKVKLLHIGDIYWNMGINILLVGDYIYS